MLKSVAAEHNGSSVSTITIPRSPSFFSSSSKGSTSTVSLNTSSGSSRYASTSSFDLSRCSVVQTVSTSALRISADVISRPPTVSVVRVIRRSSSCLLSTLKNSSRAPPPPSDSPHARYDSFRTGLRSLIISVCSSASSSNGRHDGSL